MLYWEGIRQTDADSSYIQHMNIGACKLQLRLSGSNSLKFKRGIYRSISSRVQHRFNVSIAEVSSNDDHQILTLGVSCVSNDPRHSNEVLSKVIDYIQSLRLDAEIIDYSTEIINGI